MEVVFVKASLEPSKEWEAIETDDLLMMTFAYCSTGYLFFLVISIHCVGTRNPETVFK
jgi:hypothetical protein